MTSALRPAPPASPGELQALLTAARQAAEAAYAPYSRFVVGAAVLGTDGSMHAGCNVENASYGLSICAERAAIFRAVSQGVRAIRAVAIFTPTPAPTAPCGACRQVINEFGPTASIHSRCSGDGVLDTTLASLLPDAFGPSSL